jgi:hypothetical protein
MASVSHLLTRRLTRGLSKRLDTTFPGGSGALTLLGAETAGVALDFRDMSVLVRDTATPANNFSGNVNSWLTYTSPSTKWILGQNGLYSSGTTLRTEYSAAGVALGVRIEGARTNLALRSQEFDNASWNKARSTITANATTAPDGTMTADKLIDNAVNSSHVAYFTPTLTAAVHTASVFAKAAERSQLHIMFQAGASFNTSYFNLATGAVISQGAGHTATILSVGNGWYRCSASVTNTAAAQEVDFGTADGGTASYAGDGASGIYLWQAQVELGASASSPIITAGSTVTRAADNISNVVSAMPFAAAAQTLAGKVSFPAAAAASSSVVSAFRAASYGALSSLLLRVFAPTAVEAGGNGTSATKTTSPTFVAGTAYKIAGTYVVAGTQQAVTTQGLARSVNSTLDFTGAGTTTWQIGALDGSGTQQLNGHLESMLYLPREWSGAEMQAGTT